MANKPDWGKRGVIAGYIVGIPAVAMAVLAYVHPTDTAHPIRFDFLYNQVSFSVSIWTFILDVIGATAVSYLVWTIVRHRRKPQLLIQSAFYGADDASDRDVTDVIRRAVTSNDTVSVWIDNNLFGVDPKIGKRKKLEVNYSYGNGSTKSVIRPENTLLVLPEDEWLKSLYMQASQALSELRAGPRPLSPEYLKLENDHNELKKTVFAAQQAQARTAQELDDARKQLEMPKITIAVVAFEAYEEKSEEPLTPTARLVYPTNNRILI